jgi:hypothetical protein
LPPLRPPLARHLPVLLLLACWVAGTPAAAQSPSPRLGPDGRVGAHVGLALGMGTLKGALSPQVGGRVGVDLLPWLRAGGEGVVVLDAPRVSRDESPDRSELRLGYGGVFVEMGRPSMAEGDPWAAGLLLGTGTARIRSPALGSELDSRNFVLVEPSLARAFRPVGPLQTGARIAYRLPVNPRPLVGVQPRDLRGFSFRLTLSLERAP